MVPRTAWRGLIACSGLAALLQIDGTLVIGTKDVVLALPPVIAALTDSGGRVSSLQVLEPNLENVFLHLTGTRLRD